MTALFATVAKDLLLLGRDRGGLLVLFLMPVVLVTVVCLVQENVMRAVGQTALQVVVLDAEGSGFGADIRSALGADSSLDPVPAEAAGVADLEGLRAAVARGRFQVGLHLPPGLEGRLRRDAEHALDQVFGAPVETSGAAPALEVYFDPTVRGAARSAVVSALEHAVLEAEIAAKAERFGELVADRMAAASGTAGASDAAAVARFWTTRVAPRVVARDPAREPSGAGGTPSSVQQNVPAWSLFGMFFIVVPMAGSFIRERQLGTLLRLLCMPVSPGAILAGKVLAYLLVCAAQCLLMFGVGLWLLPLLGTPQLDLGRAPGALLALCAAAALAATAYGLLVGTLFRSYEQASTFGAVSVVVAAALGGVMVPTYVMPAALRQLSVVSPLGWGLHGFLEIFVRGGTWPSVLPDVGRLLGFASLCYAVSWAAFRSRLRV